MARIRSIKPEFFTSLTVADLPLHARLTFIGLWTFVDDNGVGQDEARLVRAAVWPLDDRTAADVESDLEALRKAGLIQRYAATGRRYLAVSNWEEHQKVSHPRRPRYPTPEETAQPNGTPPDLPKPASPEPSGHPPEALPSPLEGLRPEQGSGSRDQGAGIREGARASAPAREERPEPRRPDGRTPIDDANFRVTDGMRRWAKRDGYADRVDLDYETAQFLDHFRATGARRRNWHAEWQKWIRQSNKWAGERAARTLLPAAGAENVIAMRGTTDSRVAGWLAMADQLEAQQARGQT